ncbi:unnamed protein product [Adineta steineri]|uniref:DUF7932 domain-containing protein n=1 Tax=Adineta steineri TaxID=433720 RepID=A0A813XLB1_9BILA|nr:unnamed protein product [Adineta steineri]CAF4038461.1 unnamed protein product [Adineta steineri]
MSIVTEVEPPIFSFDVNSVSERALTKPIYQRVFIGGLPGSHGYPGSHGMDGIHGIMGMPGGCGSNGSNGLSGLDGSLGQFGTDSQHALIWLSGTVEHLNMRLRIIPTWNNSLHDSTDSNWSLAEAPNDMVYNFELAELNGFILVEATGGRGGDGGTGGKGGNGAQGGNGGNGSPGAKGMDGFSKGARGGNGGPGGYGGNGGSGGWGGNGGSGGNGGNAGAGGHVQIRSVDPRLFMLIELDCRAGEKGAGGFCGKGGYYGIGGYGGMGGVGGYGGFGSGGSGSCGTIGGYGTMGLSGQMGNDGHKGLDGSVANAGSIQYTTVDIDGNIIETGLDKYHVSVSGYTITDENNDGIYEPNSDFFITNVKWINNGTMTLPYGSILSFSSTKYIYTDIKDISVLPDARINQTLMDSHRFKCHLNDASTSLSNQVYNESVYVTSQISLLNRLFLGSIVSTTLTSQYPIRIIDIQIPTCLSPNECATVTIAFENISTRSYGTCSDSAGFICFVLSTHPLLKISPINNEAVYHTTLSDGIRLEINEVVPAHTTKSIKYEITLDNNAIDQLYENLWWKIDLLLRNVIIEKREDNIRVVARFTPNIHTDVLLVTNNLVDRAEYLAYQNLFQLLNYSSQTWDIEQHGPLYHPELKWLNTTNLIIFIYSKPQSTLKIIRSHLFLRHMNSSNKAGFICIGNGLVKEFDFALFDYNNLQFFNANQKTKAKATNHLWSGTKLKQPNEKELNIKANEFRIKFEEREDHEYLYQVVYDNTINMNASNFFTVSYGAKYVFKSTLNSQIGSRLIMICSENPLLTNRHLPSTLQIQPNSNQQNEVISSEECTVDVNQIEITTQLQDIKQSKIDLNSNFGRLLCAILSYQGFEQTYQIINERRELRDRIFTLNSDKFTFNQILVSLAMSIIERECDRGSLEFQASKQLVTQITNIFQERHNTIDDFEIDNNNWLYLLIQSLYEYIDSKFSSFSSKLRFTNKAKQRFKLQEVLNSLQSLSTRKTPKNKEIYPAIRSLRLQKLANLKFPAADVREDCARPVVEICNWQMEQEI